MQIRIMNINDYESVYQLWSSTPGIGLNDVDDSREGIELYLKRNPRTCFVAVDSNNIIGVILSGHDGRRAFIHHTAVAVNYRKQGIGKTLVDYATKALATEGIHKAALIVFSNNESGNLFWESQGFSARDDLIYRNKFIDI